MLDLAGTARRGPVVQLNNLLPDFDLPAREVYRSRANNHGSRAASSRATDTRDESPTRSTPNLLSKSHNMPMPGGAAASSTRHRLLRVSSSKSTLDLSDMTMTRGRLTSSLRRDASLKQMALAASAAAAANAPFSGEIGAVPVLETGEDAITYFAKNNDQTPLKFVQLNRAPGWNEGKNWRPYDLVVVREGETLQHEYFVFSSKGVMQFLRDPAQDKIAKAERDIKPTETLTLARFLFESTIFSMLRNMKTFKNYLIWKMLGRWKGSVRFAQFCRTRALIASRLFALKELYRPLLQLAGSTMAQYKERVGSLFDLSMKRTMTLSQFTTQHTAHLENASNELDEACLVVVKFAEELPMQLEEKLRMLHKELNDDDPYKKALASMLEQRLQREGLLRDIEQTKQDQARLGDFLRMVDFVMVESLFEFAQESYNQFVHLCTNPPTSMRQGVFSTSLLLRVNPGASPDAVPEQAVRVMFSPTLAAMNAGLDEAFDASLTVIDNMQRIMLPLNMQVSDGPGSLAALDHHLCRLRAGTRKMVESHYAEAREYATSFDKYKANFAYADSFDEASFMDETSGMTWDELAEKLAEVNEWVLDVGKMRAEKGIGQLLLVESRGLKERMAMLLEEPLAVMKDRIVEAGRAKCQELIDQFHTCNSNMMIVSDVPDGGSGGGDASGELGGSNTTSQGNSPSASPRISMDLMDQAIYIENLNQAEASRQHLMNEVDVVHTIYKTLADYGVKVSIEDQTATDDLDESVVKFDQTIVLAHRYVKDQNEASKDRLRDLIASLEKQCGELTSLLMKDPFSNADMYPADVISALEGMHEKIKRVQAKTEEAQKMSQLFSGEEYTSGPLQSLNMIYEQQMSLWSSYNDWQVMWEGWLNANLEHLMVPSRSGTDFTGAALESAVDEAFAGVTKLSRKMKDNPIVAVFQKKVKYARDNVEMIVQVGHESLLPRHWTVIYSELGLTYDEKKPTRVSLKALINNGLLDPKNLDAMDEICGTAGKEFSLLRGMDSMEEEWASMDFVLQPYKETGTVILQGQGAIEEILDDQIVRTQAMRGSRFIGPFKPRIEAWEVKLRLLEEIMTNWQKTQNVWLYLEPIFSSPDIRKQMPAEAKRFKVVDKSWREVMQACKEDPAVLSITEREGVLERFIKSNALLDQIQKGLADYLNKKRIFFPRFFFLSNDELLEILSETKDPRKVQPHLKKCFEGIVRVKFRDGAKEQYDILSMISAEKESVDLIYEPVGEEIINPDDANGCVEIWLDRLQTVMRKSVAHIFDLAFEDYAKWEAEDKRTEWLALWPGQLVLGVSQTYWTMGVEKALRGGKDDLRKYCVLLQKYITDIVEMVRSPKVTKMVKKTVSPLVVLDKHALDSTQKLLDAGIDSAVDFDWLSQLRYYYHPGGESAQTAQPKSVEVKIINAVRLYAYEYLGNSMRLVVTPLTDRCYRTLMTAIHLDYGGAPAGPAGTGKTETVKDLGKACAIQCVVYNCSDSLDYKAMGKFFKGLAGTGAWSCFDEFNRITLEVLSVVAQQILTIIHAKKALKDRFDFEGENVQLRRTCNVFVTMNPGYAGRQELPDNLKALMRSVAMMVPDYAMIGEIILYSMGYYEGKSMATKVVLTYKLCSEQLSNQRHYDYGMRAVIAVLITMGNLKRKFPEENEAVLCLRGIVDVNRPKFLSFDLPLFEGIVGDLFPGITLPDIDRAEMRTVLERHIAENGLQPTDYFKGKVYEIYEMMCVRHGFMVVGQPFGGKTNALKMLAATMTTLHAEYPEDKRWHDTIYTIINPKSITMDQLYGGFDPVSHEWSDGVLAISYRNYAAEPPKVGKMEDLKWVWFDGPVDAIWIENMNTVLDNNKKLCLMSGEMMAMSDTMSMIFEPMDLEVASPATVSRVGVIFLEPHRMGWKPCLQSWLDRVTAKPDRETENKTGEETADVEAAASKKNANAGSALDDEGPLWSLSEPQAALVHKLFAWLIDPCLSFVRKGCREVVTNLDQQLVIACMRLMESIFADIMFRTEDQKKKIRKGESPAPEIKDSHIECSFLFSVIWSIGAITDEAGRKAFDQFLQEFMADYKIVERPELKGVNTLLLLREWKYPLGEGEVYKWSIPMPCLGMTKIDNADGNSSESVNASVYDYSYDFHMNKWVTWHDTIDKSPIPHEAEFSSIVVPNLVTAQLGKLLGLLINHSFPPLVVGPTGTGKSVFVKQVISQHLDQDVFKTIPTSFTAKTSANDTQSVVDNALDKRRRGVYGPAFGCRAIVFVDDFNLPEVEEYGAQPPVEIIRQLVDNGGWYDVVGGEMDFHQLEDTQLIAAMGPPGMGANDITPRMMRHFSAICITTFDSTTITQIYDAIMIWYMGGVGHNPEIAEMATNLVAATVSVYKSCSATLLPTPQKSHYTFNLRDFSRIIQGITLLKPYEGLTKESMVRLWLHESSRVIMDRLQEEADKSWFLDNIGKISEEKFEMTLDDLIGQLNPEENGIGDMSAHRRLFFGTLRGEGGGDDEERDPYEELAEVNTLVPLIETKLEAYNLEMKNQMDLVIFVFAVEHVSRIARVLAMPGGNALLVGVGGSGRQSLTRLAAFMAGYKVKQIALSKNYTFVDWRTDLCSVLHLAGTGKTEMVFLLSDTQIKEEAYVEDVNSMLNTGQVPNIFEVDEKSTIIEEMRKILKQQGDPNLSTMTNENIFDRYIQRCRDRLHIILAFSPIGDSFRERLRKFPAIINCCTIDWFYAWPKDALLSVASYFLNDVEMDDGIRDSVVIACQFMHDSVRALSEKFEKELKRINYVTPTSYLELIKCFKDNLSKCRKNVGDKRDRYKTGLEKLAFAAEQVATMQGELEAKLPVLAVAKKDTDALMKTIQEKLPTVQEMKKTVGAEAAEVQIVADETAKMAAECEADLAEAIPLLEGAIKALNTLKSSDITEVKAMKTPPGGVVMTMHAICIMMKVKPDKIKDPAGGNKKVEDFWGPSKKHLLGDSKFLQKLKDYDKDHISAKIMKVIRKKFISNPDFEPAKIKTASVAAHGLCLWVRAMEAYDRVAKVVEPKKKKLAKTQEELKVTMEQLAVKKADLKAVEDELAGLEAAFNEATAKKEQLEEDVELCEKKLTRAKQLIDGLGGEQTRWTENVHVLSDQYINVTGNVVVSAGLIAYLGAFTSDYRNKAVRKWVKLCKSREIPCSDNPALVDTLGEPTVIRQWNVEGLPTDAFSVDNGIVVFNSRRWPLMIDPQGQANKWIRRNEKENKLQVVKMTQAKYMRTIENAVQFGLPILLENVGEVLDPTLEPLLQKAVFKQGGVMCIVLGDSTVEYSDQFRFYITTKLTNPHYLPEVAVKVTLLNFMITPAGLQDQLLATVVLEERPELAKEKERLIVEGAENAATLKEIEDEILHILSSSEGNILEDESAIKALNSSKVVSLEIKEKQAVAEETEKEIDEVRKGYIPVAYHSQILYFCIADLANIEPTYEYALGWFTNLFINATRESEPSDDLETRLGILINYFTYSLYINICRSLLEKDKLLFSFLLSVRIQMGKNNIDPGRWYFLLTGGVSADNPHANPVPWMSDNRWDELCRLDQLPGFEGLRESFNDPTTLAAWTAVYESANAHKSPFPGEWESRLDLFSKILVLRSIRPDKIVLAVQAYVVAVQGDKFVKPPPFILSDSYEDSNNTTPLVFILSAGSDPMAAIVKFGNDIGAQRGSISLGQGQGIKAEKMIERGYKDGSWVILQNCHLAESWMPDLERICETMDPSNMHPDFRLWCTTYPNPNFPVTILQNSVKMSFEPPSGLRQNLMGSYTSDPISDPDFFSSVVEEKNDIYHKMMYGLCFFHAITQERRAFGALGWNNPYEFNESDLRISVMQLSMFLNLYKEIPYKALNYCFGRCNYGGRVTDDKDERTLAVILRGYFNTDIAEDNMKLSSSGTWVIPTERTYDEYIEYIDKLPIEVPPEVFGMHENANMTKDQNATTQLFNSILLTQKGGGGGGAAEGDDDASDGEEGTGAAEKEEEKTQDDISFDIAESTYAKIPSTFDMELAELKYPVQWDQSMNTVLCQELERFNKLNGVIKSSLDSFMKAVKGIVVMSSELEKLGNQLYYSKIPSVWDAASYPSLKPLASYVADFLERLTFLQKWLDNEAPPVYWISGFFFTQAFLTGTLQNFARRHTVPIDEVKFDFAMMTESWDSYKQQPDDGAYVYGLFIDGARWDMTNQLLAESEPKILFSEAPVIYLNPKQQDNVSHSTNFVMMIRIPSDRTEDFWVLQGIAMLTQLD
eukprot:g3364.t1